MRTALLLMLLAAGGCKPRTSLPQTDPKTWSKGGWQGFRWGMGPGDVELQLREAKGDLAPLRLDSLPPLEPGTFNADVTYTSAATMPALNIAGMPCRPQFSFYRGELYRLTLTPTFPDHYGPKQQWAWHGGVVALLKEKYGEPLPRQHDSDSLQKTQWSTESSVVEVSTLDGNIESIKGSGKYDRPDVWVAIVYFEPLRNKLSDGVNAADKNKL